MVSTLIVDKRFHKKIPKMFSTYISSDTISISYVNSSDSAARCAGGFIGAISNGVQTDTTWK